jgi:hypothetical protein
MGSVHGETPLRPSGTKGTKKRNKKGKFPFVLIWSLHFFSEKGAQILQAEPKSKVGCEWRNCGNQIDWPRAK